MTTYEEICKQRCDWCAKRIPLFGRRAIGVQHDCSYPHALQPCTAPTPEQVIEEQAAEITRLKGLIAELPHMPGCATQTRQHQPGPIHYEAESTCPPYHFRSGLCDCVKSKVEKS